VICGLSSLAGYVLFDGFSPLEINHISGVFIALEKEPPGLEMLAILLECWHIIFPSKYLLEDY
jgi:hypothetical protein